MQFISINYYSIAYNNKTNSRNILYSFKNIVSSNLLEKKSKINNKELKIYSILYPKFKRLIETIK